MSPAADWEGLEPDTAIVDVGGGVGSAALVLHKHFPHLQYVVQDLDGQVSAGTQVSIPFLPVSCVPQHCLQYWERNAPSCLQSGRVTLQGKFDNTSRRISVVVDASFDIITVFPVPTLQYTIFSHPNLSRVLASTFCAT